MDNNAGKVWLTIKGIADQEDSDNQDMELMTVGKAYDENGLQCISYEESEISGMKGTTTTVKFNPSRVSVIRLGEVNSIMEFEKGKTHAATYTTPFGEIDLDFVTDRVDIKYNEKKQPVHLKVNYSIKVDGMHNSDNSIDIKIKRQDKK